MLSLTVAQLVISLAVPTLLGTLISRMLLPVGWSNPILVLGHGYVLGMLLVTLLLRLLGAPNTAVDYNTALAILVGASLIALGYLYLKRIKGAPPPPAPLLKAPLFRDKSGSVKILLGILLILVLIRQLGICYEVGVRPLWAWDAVDTWVQRAQLWFLVENPTRFYFDQGLASWVRGPWIETFGSYPHPYTPSLISLWGMMAVESADLPMINMAWAFVPLALACMVYGHLRQNQTDHLICFLAAYFTMSLPYANVHAMLPGYGDLWLSAFVMSAALALSLYGALAIGHDRGKLLIFAALALLGCASSKRTGIGLAALLTLLWALLAMSRALGARLREAGTLLLSAGSLAILLILGLLSLLLLSAAKPSLAGSITTLASSLFSALSANPKPILAPLLEALFMDANWHLMPLIVLLSVPGIIRAYLKDGALVNSRLFPITASLALTLAVLAIFVFSDKYYAQIENMRTFNRALLIPAPLLIYSCALLFALSLSKKPRAG